MIALVWPSDPSCYRHKWASATMLLISAAAQPPPLHMNFCEVCQLLSTQLGFCDDVADERRSAAATASYEFL